MLVGNGRAQAAGRIDIMAALERAGHIGSGNCALLLAGYISGHLGPAATFTRRQPLGGRVIKINVRIICIVWRAGRELAPPASRPQAPKTRPGPKTGPKSSARVCASSAATQFRAAAGLRARLGAAREHPHPSGCSRPAEADDSQELAVCRRRSLAGARGAL